MPISFILDICHTSGIVTHGIRSPGLPRDVQRTVPDDGKERSVIAGERNMTDIHTMADGRRDLSRKGERGGKMHRKCENGDT